MIIQLLNLINLLITKRFDIVTLVNAGRWEERSRDFIVSFLEMFGREGRIVSGGSGEGGCF